MKRKILFVILFFAAILVAFTLQPPPSEENISPPKVQAASSFEGVDEKFDSILNDGTEYAVYLTYPQKSPEKFIRNSKQMRSASMIKVFILAAVMEKVQSGEISLDESIILKSSDKVGGAGILVGYQTGSAFPLREILKLMITHSDNTATNIVIDRVGMSAVNEYISRNGYADTILQRKMMDFNGLENYSSVRDLGEIFLKIYRHNCVSEELDEMMIDFLKQQTDTDCFPSALPGKTIAHKTGALVGLYDDGGIIYNGEGDAVLVIMTENFTSEYTAIQRMKTFARAVVD